MDSLKFMTCDELREAFKKCRDDYNKRILIIDVRSSQLFARSHLCLDARHKSISRRIGVLNIDVDLLKPCTAQKIMPMLKQEDASNFKMRKECDEVIIVDKNTDNFDQICVPGSKVMRLINALTKFDNQPEKITDPKEVLHVLKGGFREWMVKYPHFTTNPSIDPELIDKDIKPFEREVKNSPSNETSLTPLQPSNANHVNPSIESPTPVVLPTAPPPPKLPPASTKPMVQPSAPILIMKPTPPPPTTKPSIVKNAPGTAVPVSSLLSLRATLPRSQSSPNVAQADGDELDESLDQLGKLNLSGNHESFPLNDNNYSSSNLISKPRFDRTLKPAINNEHISAIRAQLNFGRSPEASGKAISGLQNLGNTCFMNSVIQCLAYSQELVSYFCSDLYYNHINFKSQYGSKGELAIEFGALVEKLNTHRHRYIEPKSFREAVSKHIGFVGNEQQDSHEFMMMLFDKLHHDLNVHAKDKYKQNGFVMQKSNCNNEENNINKPRAILSQFWKKHLEMNKSVISEMFEGIFMSTLTCTFCKGESNTFEVFNCLSLPIASETRCNVRDCLSHFSNPERIDAEWECPRCKMKREAEKKIVICKLPRVLIIHLKRFSLDGRWRQKLQTFVDFPLGQLNVGSTDERAQQAYETSPVRGTYVLQAVVNHYGHLDGGHYTAFCKMENHKWYTFDDSNVYEMKETDVCSQAAYILFYAATC